MGEDKKVKDRIDGRNGLEGYCYNLKNTLEDEEKGIADKLSEEDKEKIEEVVKETLEWLDDNQEAEKEEFEARQKELEQIANPIIQKFTKQVLVVPVVNQKMTKIWMMKIAMNCKFSICNWLFKAYVIFQIRQMSVDVL